MTSRVVSAPGCSLQVCQNAPEWAVREIFLHFPSTCMIIKSATCYINNIFRGVWQWCRVVPVHARGMQALCGRPGDESTKSRPVLAQPSHSTRTPRRFLRWRWLMR